VTVAIVVATVAGTRAIEMYALPIGLDAGEQYASARTFFILCQLLLQDEAFSVRSEIALFMCLNVQDDVTTLYQKVGG